MEDNPIALDIEKLERKKVIKDAIRHTNKDDETPKDLFKNKGLFKNKNLLKDTRCYLIGHMQYMDGRSWREDLKEVLNGRGIKFYDPYHKPFIHDVPEDNDSREEMLHWMDTQQYDLVQQRMWAVRGYDLRLCDICDFFVAHIVPNVASWGSAEEISTVIRQKKPLFLSIEGGKRVCPLWLMGVVPHKYIYDSIEEVIQTIKHIDNGIIRMSSDRWKLLLPEMR
jgi:hypothetical protein